MVGANDSMSEDFDLRSEKGGPSTGKNLAVNISRKEYGNFRH